MTTIKTSMTLLLLLTYTLGLFAQEKINIEVIASGDDRFVLKAANAFTGGASALAMRLQSGADPNLGEGNITIFARNYNALPGFGGYFDLDGKDGGLSLRASDVAGAVRIMTGGSNVNTHTRMFVSNLGNVGIGTQTPASKLQISGGFVYLSDISTGMILRSPDGTCWTTTVANTGTLTTTSASCP